MITLLENNLTEATVAELVCAAQQGDREAFGELFERYHRHVLATALRRLGDYSEAQELCQEVFVQALQKIDQLRVPEAFGGWLRSITHRMAINRAVRRAPVTATDPEVLTATCIEPATPLAAALVRERNDELAAGLKRLQPMDRDTLVSFYVRGHSLAEMAEEFDAPVGTIKRRLHVARKRLARQVEELAV